MGMFDEIRCEAPLPDDYQATGAWFQTKSFPGPAMQRYKITSAGRLIDALGNDLEPDGYIAFYSSDPDKTWREYRAHFSTGQLHQIVRVIEDPEDPIRYGLASYRWFSAPSFMFDDDSDDSGLVG
jgi:hypothetical protein